MSTHLESLECDISFIYGEYFLLLVDQIQLGEGLIQQIISEGFDTLLQPSDHRALG